MASVNLISKVKATVSSWLAKIQDDTTTEVPKEGDPTIPSVIGRLWQESFNWRQSSLEYRLDQYSKDYYDPVYFWKQARKLEQGAHWEVWGRRNTAPGDSWQHELVDDEIGNQVRVKKAYLTGNWHDVTIFPNIDNINKILDQERMDTSWGDVISLGIHKGLTEGTIVWMSVLDKSEDPDGKAREIVCDNASIFPTPFCTGFSKTDGCWFVIYATIEQRRFIEKDYPELKDMLLEVDKNKANEIVLTSPARHAQPFKYNGMVDKMVCYMDDDTLENIPFSAEEIDQEHAQLHEGKDIKVERDQNHREHVRQHTDWLENTVNSVPEEERSPEDRQFIEAISQYMLIHIHEHIKVGQRKLDNDGIPIGKRKKYPFGRKIVTVSNHLAEDIPSPYDFDWRKLFHKWEPEKLPESFWGRGIPEVLWNTNKTLDTMLSRIADVSLAAGMPKPWFHVSDKPTIEENKYTNDPLEPAYYTVSPPIFRNGQAPHEPLEIYNAMKQNASKQLGVNQVSYGASPSPQASGELVDRLMQQNQVIVTGESNERLSNVIEDIIESRLMMWKQFYTEPRMYYINDSFRAVNLSKTLSIQKVKDPATGQMQEKEIPSFQVSVKPGSNLANQWQEDLAFAMQLYNMKGPDGMPLIPKEAILDLIDQRYPQFGRSGDYYQLSEAMKIGLQVLSQEQARKKDEVRTLKRVRESFKKKGLQEMMQHGMAPDQGQPSNGTGAPAQ